MRKTISTVAAVLTAVFLTGSALAAQTHPAYLTGYPDGTIRPQEALSRQQLCQILLRFLPEDAPCGKSGYLDLSPLQWSYHAISTAITLEIYPALTGAYFEPKKSVSAEEFRQVIENASEYLPELSKANTDFAGEFVTRADAAKIFNTCFARCDKPGMKGMLCFTDISPEDACYRDMIEAANTHTAENGRWCALG